MRTSPDWMRSGKTTGRKVTYLRLGEANIARVLGFKVPQLLGYDAELWVLEMTVVQQPFVLDFAEVRPDFPVEFPADVGMT